MLRAFRGRDHSRRIPADAIPAELRLPVHAHLVQLDIAWEDAAANFRRVRDLLGAAPVRPGDLVLLPEMFDTGFSLNVEATADAGGTLSFLAGLARELGAYVQGGRTVAAAGGRATNRATAVAPDGSVVCDYRKIHPFSLGREPERFDGGDEVTTYDWAGSSAPDRGLKVCPAVCYDLRFPELFRLGLLKGAEAYTVGANWPESRRAHWRALLVARAIENQAFVLGVNRTGRDPNLAYAGGSIAVGPRGSVLGELGPEEGVLSVEIDPREVHAWRGKFPAWRDARLLSAGG